VRAITHIHTRHSWDGSLAPSCLVDALVEAEIDLAVVSDHDSFQGALECRRLVGERALALRIPVAAEIRTDRGDVIVIFETASGSLPPITELKEWRRLVPAVRQLDGLIWLAHPYRAHEFVEELAATADVVEVFNARCLPEENRNAALLCGRHDGAPGYGADIHRRAEIGSCIVDYEDRDSIIETLRHAPAPIVAELNPQSSIMAAEITNARKRRRPAKLAYSAIRWIQYRRRELAVRWRE
jgi:predicted metal-dependent phosphoesterase TrpH